MIKYCSIVSFDRHTVLIFFLTALLAVGAPACKISDGPSGEEDEKAGELVRAANADLIQISKLYAKNENKRGELKNALNDNNEAEVKKICEEIIVSINSGKNFAKDALDKINEASEMKINPDYQDYLDLKGRALKNQIEAFKQYREAAETLAKEYDPKDEAKRRQVDADFKKRGEKFEELMDEARKNSEQANEIAKRATQKSVEK